MTSDDFAENILGFEEVEEVEEEGGDEEYIDPMMAGSYSAAMPQ